MTYLIVGNEATEGRIRPAPELKAKPHGPGLPRSAILVRLRAIFQDGSQRIRRRPLNKLQSVGVVMIEWKISSLHQKLGLDEISPASIVVERDVAPVAIGAESFFQ